MAVKLTTALVTRLTKQPEKPPIVVEIGTTRVSIPPVKELDIADTVIPRLHLRMKTPKRLGAEWPSWWAIRYVNADGQERRLSLGSTKSMTLEEARKLARTRLAAVDHGRDPAAEADERREAWTVEQAIHAYLASPEASKKTDRSRYEDGLVARNHLIHHLGWSKLTQIDAPAVKRLIHAVETDSRVGARKRRLGGFGAARKAVRLLSSIMTWAVGAGHLSRNVIAGNIRLSGDNERSEVLAGPEDYRKLFAAIDSMVEAGELRLLVGVYLKVLALTGMRRNELRTLTWGQVDLIGRRLLLHSTKGAKLAKKGPRTETVSLPALAAAELASIRPDEVEPTDQVFRPYRGKVLKVNEDWIRVRDRAGLSSGLVLHSLRHSAGTAGIMAGMSTAEVQQMLRHRNISVTQKYIHIAEAAKARLQDRAADWMLGATPDESDQGSSTRSLQRKA
jgi:integrase